MTESKFAKWYLHFDLFGLCWNIHILPKEKSYQFWGYLLDWYDGPIHSFGIGPLLYICTHEEEYIHRRKNND